MSHTPHSLILTPTDRTTTSPSRHILPPLSHLPDRHATTTAPSRNNPQPPSLTPSPTKKFPSKRLPDQTICSLFPYLCRNREDPTEQSTGPSPATVARHPITPTTACSEIYTGDRPQRDFHQRPTAARFTPPTACSEVFPRPLAGPKAPNSSRSRYRLKNNQHG